MDMTSVPEIRYVALAVDGNGALYRRRSTANAIPATENVTGIRSALFETGLAQCGGAGIVSG